MRLGLRRRVWRQPLLLLLLLLVCWASLLRQHRLSVDLHIAPGRRHGGRC
jgi:hypothetical protein